MNITKPAEGLRKPKVVSKRFCKQQSSGRNAVRIWCCKPMWRPSTENWAQCSSHGILTWRSRRYLRWH